MFSVASSGALFARVSSAASVKQTCKLSTTPDLLFWKRAKKEPEADFDLGTALDATAPAALDSSEEAAVQSNRSRMSAFHRCLALDVNPVEAGVPLPTPRKPVALKRRLFGEFGLASGVDPGELYHPIEKLRRWRHLEVLGYPETLSESLARVKAQREAERRRVEEEEAEIERRLAKAVTLRQQIEDRIAKKEAEIRAQQEKKQRMMEEIREHFGYSVDPKTEKFQEMMAQKEAEEKKAEKERKKKEKQAKQLAKLLVQSQKGPGAVTENPAPEMSKAAVGQS